MNHSLASASSLLESLVNHLALPLRLPGKADDGIDRIERAISSRLLDASRTLRDLTNAGESYQWDCTRNTLRICNVLNAGGKLNKKSLLAEFQTLERKDLLILHVAEQNAGLLVRRHHG